MTETRDIQKDARSFLASFETTLRDGLKLKKVMQKKDLRKAKAKCPECDGMLFGILAGPKNHIHMACDGPCKRRMME